MSTEHLAIIAVIVAAASELIGMNKNLRSNSVVQLILSGLLSAFPKKTK